MKKQILIIALLLFSSAIFAQGPIAKGESQINVGVGFSSWGVPIYLGFDYGVHQDITVGAEFSYRAYTESGSHNHTILSFSGNGNYHFNNVLDIPSPWDVYAGLNLGFYVWSSPKGYAGSHTSGLGVGAQIGARYYFSNRVGVNLEFGGGNASSGGKIGLTFKL